MLAGKQVFFMKKIAERLKALRKELGMTQAAFAAHINASRAYISQLEGNPKLAKSPSPKFMEKIVMVESSTNARQLAEQHAAYRSGVSNVDPKPIRLRQIPIYTFVQAGQAVEYEGLPTRWEDTIEYDGNDERAFALRVAGDSMEPKFPAGTIITVSPKYPPHSGQLVVARIKNEGCVFKLFHHSGDGKIVTLSSYNPLYEKIVLPRENLHWLYRVVRSTQNL